jgi:Xaa-Pro aminopeptidase
MSHAPSAALDARHHTVRSALASRHLDALVVTALPNILYLTNFDGSAAIAVLTADRLYFLTDFRYITAVGEAAGTAFGCRGLELITVQGSYDATLAALLASLPLRSVGFEAAHLTVSRYDWIRAALPRGEISGPDFLPTEGIVEAARLVKDAHEVATIREAARRLSRVAAAAPGDIRPGRSERDVAMALDARMREAGFARPAFDTIVASGANSALPHARPGERKLSEGDLVVLDFGGVYDSYCVDLTRTVAVGRASARAREVYQAVLEAHDAAIACVRAARPGAVRYRSGRARRARPARSGRCVRARNGPWPRDRGPRRPAHHAQASRGRRAGGCCG